MKQNLDFSFVMGYISSLDSKLLTNSQIEKIKKSKTIEEFTYSLKKEKYEIENLNNIDEINVFLDKKLKDTISEIKKISPKTKSFEYLFCKEYFKALKIGLKEKQIDDKIKNLSDFLGKTETKNIENFIENEDFSSIKPLYKKPFRKCLEIFLKYEEKKQAEILIDKEMYKVLLEISKKDNFLNKRTKLEISLKNIGYIVRNLLLNNNINKKELEIFLIENGELEKTELIKKSEHGLKEMICAYENLNVDISNSNLIENFSSTDEIEKEILAEFDKKYIFENFCFTPIFIYISSLKKEIEILKKIILNIKFNMF